MNVLITAHFSGTLIAFSAIQAYWHNISWHCNKMCLPIPGRSNPFHFSIPIHIRSRCFCSLHWKESYSVFKWIHLLQSLLYSTPLDITAKWNGERRTKYAQKSLLRKKWAERVKKWLKRNRNKRQVSLVILQLNILNSLMKLPMENFFLLLCYYISQSFTLMRFKWGDEKKGKNACYIRQAHLR